MSQPVTENSLSQDEWEGDCMQRKKYAEFLSQFIAARMSKSDAPLTIALDAAWGTGKTFFIGKWSQDIRTSGGGVVVFDAWKNDFSDEVLVSFMSELSNGLTPLRARVSIAGKSADVIKVQTRDLMRGFGKAVLPAAGIVAKGVLKKVTGIAVDEIAEAMNSGEVPDIMDIDVEAVTEGLGGNLEKGLERFFEKTLEAHKERAKSTEAFRSALESLVGTLQLEKAIAGPLYVFVDELDRCRPDYAIRLLEGIKHLFSVKGVVFVISTNIDQLSKSIQVVYGGRFDGRSYLKRFFDFDFTLPPPDSYSFASVLMAEVPLFGDRELDFGLHESVYTKDNRLARCFELVATSCSLSLRSQRQVWLIAAAASVGVPANAKVSVMWLFFLSVLKHSHAEAFEAIGDDSLPTLNVIGMADGLKGCTQKIVQSKRSAPRKEGSGTWQEPCLIPLLDVLHVYHMASFSDLAALERKWTSNSMSYPNTITDQMCQERPTPFDSKVVYRPAIHKYQELVRMAGLIS